MALRIGCCITPHGFGHAARTAAVIEAVGKLVAAEFVVVTTVPEWFFAASLSCPFRYSPMSTDIGLVQKSSLQEDLQATVRALDGFYPLSDERIAQAMELFSGCELILCDIAPLGIVAARRLGIPSFLIENFTWDWIYSHYLVEFPDLLPHIEYLQEVYGRATHHLQTTPVCQPIGGLPTTAPISRAGKTSRLEIRRQLRVGAEEKLVLITMGGLEGDTYAVEPLRKVRGYVFMLGGLEEQLEISGNIRCLPKASDFYHPDLVAAADLVVGKAGYSTLAEVFAAGVSFGYILRKNFSESAVLADFIQQETGGAEIAAIDLLTGRWLQQLDDLTTLQPVNEHRTNGALAAARLIVDLLHSGK